MPALASCPDCLPSLPAPASCCGLWYITCVLYVYRHTPADVIILPVAATCYTMEVSTIPGEPHPGLGSAGSINAVPSAGRGRHSLGLVIPAHKPHEPPWPSRATQSFQTYIPMADPPPGDACGLAQPDTPDGISTIFSPVGTLPTIMHPREPWPIPSRKESSRCPTRRSLDTGTGRSQQTLPDAARVPPSAPKAAGTV